MRLGYFTMPLHPPTRNYTDVLKEDRESIVLADRLGFVEAFVGEHVTDLAEPVTSCTDLHRLADRRDARRSCSGTGTVNLPNTHPAQVAAQVAMIDHLLEGRFLFGISPGGLLSDAEAFGNLDRDRTAMFVEAIDQVLAIWAGEAPYDLQRRVLEHHDAAHDERATGQGSIVKPYQRPHPPIVVTAVAPFSKGVTSAAERGWTPISANFLQPNWVASHWPKYQRGLRERRRGPPTRRTGASRRASSSPTTRRRRSATPKATTARMRTTSSSLMTKLIGNGRPELFKADREMPDEAITLDYVLDSLVICGTVDSVVEQLLAFRDRIGDFGTLLYAGHDWADPVLARRSMELMATEVMPRVNAAIARGPRCRTELVRRVARAARSGSSGWASWARRTRGHLLDAGFADARLRRRRRGAPAFRRARRRGAVSSARVGRGRLTTSCITALPSVAAVEAAFFGERRSGARGARRRSSSRRARCRSRSRNGARADGALRGVGVLDAPVSGTGSQARVKDLADLRQRRARGVRRGGAGAARDRALGPLRRRVRHRLEAQVHREPAGDDPQPVDRRGRRARAEGRARSRRR